MTDGKPTADFWQMVRIGSMVFLICVGLGSCFALSIPKPACEARP